MWRLQTKSRPITITTPGEAYICYDQVKDHLYVFYRPLNTSAQVLCDIVAVSTGTAVMTEIELATVGSYSYMEPYWCSFDEEQGLARFVWATGTNLGHQLPPYARLALRRICWHQGSGRPELSATQERSTVLAIPAICR